jgi:DNA-binding NarL/FixJ family response regulator
MRTTKILVVDDHGQWRSMLRTQLEANSGFQVIAEAVNGFEAIQKAAQLHPDVVLLDLGMPLLNGLEAAPRIRRVSPESKIVFVTQESNRDIRAAALATGAEGYLLKSKVVPELIPALDAILMATVPEALEAPLADGHNFHPRLEFRAGETGQKP